MISLLISTFSTDFHWPSIELKMPLHLNLLRYNHGNERGTRVNTQ